MRTSNIKNIQGFIVYIKDNSTWQAATIRNVIRALGCAAFRHSSLVTENGELKISRVFPTRKAAKKARYLTGISVVKTA